MSLFRKRIVLGLLAAIFVFSFSGCSHHYTVQSVSTHVVTDMGGRSVTIPKTISKVFCTNPIGTVDVYTLAPQKLAGWNFKLTSESLQYIDAKYRGLPALGVWMGTGATPNIEQITKVHPDVLLCFWSIDQNGKQMADQIQRQTHLPVLLMDYNVDSVEKVYRYLGGLLGVQARAETLAQNSRALLDRVTGAIGTVAEADEPKIFISEGVGGLQTDPVGSLHIQDAADLLHLNNVVNLTGASGQGMGMPTVSVEQLMNWDPHYIFVNEYNLNGAEKSNNYNAITTSVQWAGLSAVKQKHVYDIPQIPFSWFGKPPSVMRVLGAAWVAGLTYPDKVKLDIRQEAKDFYKLYLNHNLSDAELSAMLAHAE
ncbi:MAG: ABC transporter substrate-binding protein [Ethanoligenens sp.]